MSVGYIVMAVSLFAVMVLLGVLGVMVWRNRFKRNIQTSIKAVEQYMPMNKAVGERSYTSDETLF